MVPFTEPDLMLALHDCFDPQLPCNIVDLGLVESVSLLPDADAPGSGIPGVPPKFLVRVALLPTTADEAAHAQLRAQVANRLAGIEAISRATVDLLDQPLWTPLRITPAGRRILGLDGNRNLVQIR